MSDSTLTTFKAGQDKFDYTAFISWAKSSSNPTVGSTKVNIVNIVDADWRPEFDMEDHNRMCRQLDIVPYCDIVAAAKKTADEKAGGQPKEKAEVTANVNTPFRLRTF